MSARMAVYSLNAEETLMADSPKKIALVTGANKGIGLGIARELGKAGFTVLIGARKPSLGEEAATKLQSEGLDALFLPLDIVQQESIKAAAASIDAQFQRLDVLVNNAGIADAADGPPSAADLNSVRRVMETNFVGTLAVTQCSASIGKNLKRFQVHQPR